MKKITTCLLTIISISFSNVYALDEMNNHATQNKVYGFFDFFSSSPSTSDLQKEINDLREEIAKIKEQQIELISTINTAKEDFISNRDEQKRQMASCLTKPTLR